MANQPPPARPWFRLASLALRESPQPAPPSPPPTQTFQPPRGPPIRQLVRQPGAVLPSQPQPAPVQPQPETAQPPQPPQPQPLSQAPPPPPPPQPSVTPPQGESTEPGTPSVEPPKQPSSPLPTLRPIKTSRSPPLQSPKVNKSPSPSPRYDSGDRTLKPSPEPELKTIPEAQPKTTTNNDKGEPHKNARNGEQKLGTSQADSRGPPPSPKRETKKKDEADLRLITMAGENMGAYMDLGSLSGRKQKQQQQQSNDKQGQVSNSATNDGKSSDKDGTRAAAAAAAKAKAKPMTSLVNSNVQSVNNSIVYNSSCTQRSPGVKINLTSHRDPKSKAHPPPQ